MLASSPMLRKLAELSKAYYVLCEKSVVYYAGAQPFLSGFQRFGCIYPKGLQARCARSTEFHFYKNFINNLAADIVNFVSS